MTEEEKMKFWGDLVEPIVALLGGLTVRGEFKLVEVTQDIIAKAEQAYEEGRKDENEACAKVCEELGYYAKHGGWGCADAIRARREQ